jgi:hypothetical protein
MLRIRCELNIWLLLQGNKPILTASLCSLEMFKHKREDEGKKCEKEE